MSDERPVLPWLEPGSEASADVRAVLASARSDGLSPAQVDALAHKVLALSAHAAVAASSAPAASSAGVSLGAKITVATLLLAIGGAGAWITSARAKLDARVPATESAQSPSRVASAGREPQRTPSTSGATLGDRAPRALAPSVSVTPRVERRAARSSVNRADAGEIATESAVSPADDAALLHRAAAALRGGATSEAIALVARHRRWFAESALSEERERIEIEALVRDGQRERARGAAARFRRQFPGSAQQPRIDALVSRDAPP